MPLLGGVWETNVAHSRILDTPPPDLHNAHTVHYSVKAHLSREVDKSKEKSIEINMATEFSDILARNIIHICFGEDLSDD